MGTTAAEGEEGRRLLFDLPEGVIRRDADRKIDSPAIAGTEKPATRIRPEERRLQQTFLRRQGEHRIRHATAFNPCSSHLRHHVSQPARVYSTARSEIENELVGRQRK